MEGPQRSLFRESALQRYIHGRQRDVLPRLISPGRVFLLWVLLFVFLAALFVVFLEIQHLFGV